MPFLLLIASPIGRYVAGAVAVLAVIAAIYLAGANHARRAAEMGQLEQRERADAAVDRYRDDGGAAERLRSGKF